MGESLSKRTIRVSLPVSIRKLLRSLSPDPAGWKLSPEKLKILFIFSTNASFLIGLLESPWNIVDPSKVSKVITEFNTKEIRQNQIYELLRYICENKRDKKFHLVTGCFYDSKKFKEMISLADINNIITNLKTNSQNNYIFIYSENLVENLNKLNDYLKENFNIFIVKQNIYNLGINEHCPFETILSIENLKNWK